MSTCTLCRRSEASYICVCKEEKVCGPCLLSHQKSDPRNSHRPVPISHPLLSLMLEANEEVKNSPIQISSIESQIQSLELIRDQHYSLMNEKIMKLKLQLNLSFQTHNLSVRGHRKSQSLCNTSENLRKTRNFVVKSIKLVVLGADGVGKKTLENGFAAAPATARQDLSNRLCKCFVNGNQKVNLTLTIVPNKGTLRSSYFFRAKGAIFVFDLGEKESFLGINEAFEEVLREVSGRPFLFVVGNNKGVSFKREVERKEVDKVVNTHEGMYFEVNLMDETQVSAFFKTVIEKLCEA